jgi:hypothetical protein
LRDRGRQLVALAAAHQRLDRGLVAQHGLDLGAGDLLGGLVTTSRRTVFSSWRTLPGQE